MHRMDMNETSLVCGGDMSFGDSGALFGGGLATIGGSFATVGLAGKAGMAVGAVGFAAVAPVFFVGAGGVMAGHRGSHDVHAKDAD